MNWITLFFVFLAGIFTSLQAGVNAGLGKKIGSLEAAFISFVTGTLFLGICLLFYRKGNLMQVFEAPKWQLLGGLCGAFYIFVMVIAVPRIGIASALVTLIVGQLLCSTLIDHFGWMGREVIAIDWKRIAGLMLMGAAVFLFYKK